MIKPGYQTTEFWLTIISNVFAILTAFGVPAVLSNTQEQAIATVAALLASAITTIVYTHQRGAMKRIALALPPAPLLPPLANAASDATPAPTH
jgi:branched-subunit amino acid transport protein